MRDHATNTKRIVRVNAETQFLPKRQRSNVQNRSGGRPTSTARRNKMVDLSAAMVNFFSSSKLPHHEVCFIFTEKLQT